MALERQIVPVPFRGGVDEKSDPKQVPIGKLLKAQDAVYATPGELKKRNGYTALNTATTGGSNVTAAKGLMTYQSELLEPDGASVLWSYSAAVSGWNNGGNIYQPTSITTTGISSGAVNYGQGDSAYSVASNLQCIVYGALVSIIDTITGQKILADYSIGGAEVSWSRVVVFASNFVLFYRDSTDHKIKYKKILLADPNTIGSAVTLSVAIDGPFDVVVQSNNHLTVAYNLNGTTIGVLYLNSSFTATSPASATVDATGDITVFEDSSNNIWVGCMGTAHAKAVVFKPDLSGLQLAVTNLEDTALGAAITGIVVSGTTAHFFYTVKITGQYNSNTIRSIDLTLAGAVTVNGVVCRSLALISKVFSYTTDLYALTTYGGGSNVNQTASDSQPTNFVINLTRSLAGGVINNTAFVVAKVAPLSASTPIITATLPMVNSLGSGVFQTIFLQLNQFSSNHGNSSLTFSLNQSPQSKELGQMLNLTGGLMSSYDGNSTNEQNFNLFPTNPNVATSNSGGSIVGDAVSSYSYVTVYEWNDSHGNMHQSAPSPASAVVPASGSSNSAVVTVWTLRVTSKNNVQIAIYRTAIAGSIYYRIGSKANDTTVDTLTFSDIYADTSITGNRQLYTTGGTVANSATPAPQTMGIYKNRLFAVPSETPYICWFSKQLLQGTPVEFSALFTFTIDQRGGTVTVMQQLDDKLIIFKAGMIFYMVGDGPADNGTGNTYSPPQLLASDVGCINQASVVLTDIGIFFQSVKGICLLDRSLAVKNIGVEVDPEVIGYNVTSATLMANYSRVYFTLSSGKLVAYDYLVNEWSVFTNHSAVAAVNYNNLFYYAQSNGLVLKEAVGTFTDNGTNIALLAQTSWIQLAGLQGFQRVYKVAILGTFVSAHTLRVQIAYDFDPTVVQTDDIVTSAGVPYQYRILLERQKCEAIQITVQDLSNSGEAYNISGITLEIGVKGGINRLATTKTFS